MAAAVASIRYLVVPVSADSYRFRLRRNGARAHALQVAIRSLGAFRLFRDGVPVAASAWQSKKARTLLKILVARRGRATPRDLLMEALWPGEDPARLANRLSVALATARAVLDPDKRRPAESFIAADKESMRLDLEHVAVDVEAFLRRAHEGLALARGGQTAEGAATLAQAEALYTGDFSRRTATAGVGTGASWVLSALVLAGDRLARACAGPYSATRAGRA